MISAPLKDSIPPYHEEAEWATLGALLLNFSSDIFEDIQQYVRPESFFKGAHQIIFQAILRLVDKNEGVDILTLTDELAASDELDKAGGASYLASLTSRVPTTANIAYYAKIVQITSIRRELINVARGMISNAHDDSKETRLIIDDAERSIFDLSQNQNRGILKPAREVIQNTINEIENRYQLKEPFTGIPCGFGKLDALTSGFQNSEMIILGARPSIGKTAMALCMATNIAIKNHIPCGFFTLEMSAESLMKRIIASEIRINSNNLRNGLLKPADFHKIGEIGSSIYEAPLIIQDTPNISLLDLRSLARKMVLKKGVKIIFIDYIGLISVEDTRLPRYEQVSSVSHSLKALARELDIPIVILSQVGRQSQEKAPTLADIRESGALEQDADVVIFLHRDPKKPGEEDDDSIVVHNNMNGLKTKLIVAKQRNGPTDKFDIIFFPQYTRYDNFTDYTP